MWILFSDRLLGVFASDPNLLIQMGTAKGWLFTFVTSLLLYELIRRSERSRQESYNLLHDVVEGTTDAIFVKDRQGRYILANRSAAQCAGKPLSEILGNSDREVFAIPDVPHIQANDRAIMESGVAQQLEETVSMGDRTVTYLTTKVPRFDESGRVIGLIGISRDISERKHLERQREQLLEQVQQHNRELNALNLVTANAVSTLELDALLNVLLDRLIGVVEADLGVIFLQQQGEFQVGAKLGSYIRETDHLAIEREIARMIVNTGQPIEIENIQQDSRFSAYVGGSARPRHVLGVPLRRQNHLVGVLQVEWHQSHTVADSEIHLLEIAAERCAMAILNAQLFDRTQQLQQRLQLQFDRSPIACIVYDAHGCFNDWNPAAETIFGYTKSEALGRRPGDLIVPATARAYVSELMDRLYRGEMEAHGFNENITKDGRTIVCEWYNTPLACENGRVVGILSMAQDVTERVRAQEQLQQYAYYDSLTRLPRRRLLIERLETLMRGNARERSPFALLHLDLVRFKVVKYSLGHQLAEELLLAAIERLKACLPPDGMLARIGTDEFAIVIERLTNLDDAIQRTEAIQQEFAFPFHLENHSVFIKVNAGLVWGATCQTAEELLQAADIAMHHSRLSKGTNYAVFEPAMQAQAVRRLQLDSDMHRALERQEFQLYYQPIVAIDTQQLVGFEALIRWQQRHEWISPAAFIPLAEETGFIIPLGEWILRQACWQMQQWCRNLALAPSDYVTVNVSAVQLMQPGFVESVDRILHQTQLPPQRLKLEVTETAVMENARQVSRVLEQLQERQIGLCIDDFGTGYSSLSYLHAFPFNTLKIDRSFVSNLEEHSKSLELIHTIVVLAKNLEMDIVAEGVETVEQLRQLGEFGCDRAQGYLFSRPLSCFQIEQMLGNGRMVWEFPTGE